MARTVRTVRRAMRAALTVSRHLVTAARGARFGLLVALYRAIDNGQTVRIRYTDTAGTVSIRDITPRRLDPTNAGHITCRAFDWRDSEDTTFRTDRMTIAPNPQPTPGRTTPAVTITDPWQSPTTHVLLTAPVGPYTVTLHTLEGADHSYGVDVHRPATEDEAFLYGGPEGAPVLADQWGGHTFEDALAEFDNQIGWYALASDDDTPGRVAPARLPLKPGVPLGDGATAVSVEDDGHDSVLRVTDSTGRAWSVSRWATITLHPGGVVHLDTPSCAGYAA